MQAIEGLAKIMLYTAVALVLMAMLSGCTIVNSIKSIGDTYSDENARQLAEEQKTSKKSRNSESAPDDIKDVRANSAVNTADNEKAGLIINIKNSLFSGKSPQTPPPATLEVPAPELTNINLYAAALEEKLQRRYNNTPKFSGKVAKVQLIPVGEPKVSLDGQKMRIEWSQIVFDIWGERITELEKEYYAVTFGDGKPLMQRTRPSITVGLNNEGGYSEYSQVRGGKLSTLKHKGNPGMFDRADSEKTGLLDLNLEAKNSADAPYLEYDLPAAGGYTQYKSSGNEAIPVISPAGENLQAVTVNERIAQ